MAHILSVEAKEAIIKKVLSCNGQTMKEIASLHNVGYSTLHQWVARFKLENSLEAEQKSSASSPATLLERFKHLQATFGQEDVIVGAYCRKHGLYPHQLTQWEADFMIKPIHQKDPKQAAEVKALQTEIKSLKQMLLRKDKVLAETVALLILKKKATQIWGDSEDD